MLITKKLAIIGNGYMCDAIVKGLKKANAIPAVQIYIVNLLHPENAQKLAAKYGAKYGAKDELKDCDLVILGFKPQNLKDAMEMYRDCFSEKQLIISILAGVTTESLEKALPCPAPVARVMPNLALGVGQSATIYCSGKHSAKEQESLTEELFSYLGTIIKLEEEDINGATAISGCGPGYIYFLAEAMAEAASNLGLDQETALALVSQTFYGTALLYKDSGEAPAVMRKRICSPQGATEVGINTLRDEGFYNAVLAGVKAACQRAQELGQLSQNK